MATNAIAVGPGTFTIGAELLLTNFAGQVTSLKVVPSVDYDDDINVLDGGTVTGDRKESWTVSGTLLQDFGSTDSKTEFLFEHRGEAMPFVFTPNSSMGKEIRGSLVVEAIEIGGDVKTKPTSDFEFKMVGAPVISAAAIPGA